jgi:fibronectin type 3 domain-containing protein
MRISMQFRINLVSKCLIFYSFAVVAFAQSDRVKVESAAGNFGAPGVFHEMSTTTSPKISYVQGNYATPQTSESILQVKYTSVQTSGDLNVVVVGWNDSTAIVTTVTDSSGNTYARALGPTVYSGYLSQSIYYARNIKSANAGANTVKVTFSVAAQYPDIRIAEYRGADQNNPVETVTHQTGDSSRTSSGTITTTNPTDLLFAANIVETSTGSPGIGFTKRMITSPDGDIIEDQMVTATGSYNATATLGSSGPWIMQMVAFRTLTIISSGSGTDTTPPTAPSNLAGSVVGATQFNLSWTASTDSDSPNITYHVERCQGPGCSSFAQIATPTATSYSDTSVVGNISYSYRVRASDPSGNLSGYSNVISETTPNTATLSLTPGSINFGNVPMGTDGTQSVQISNPGTTSITISQANVAGNEFSVSGLNLPLTLGGGQNSTFQVAFTPASAGAVTGSVSLVSNATSSPTKEALSGTGVHFVDLSWTASTSSVIGYNVYRGTVSGGPYSKINSSLIGGTTYSDTSVSPGQTYYYVTTAVNSSNNESAYSDQAVAAVPSP